MNLPRVLETLNRSVFTRYRGRLIEKCGSEFKVSGKLHSSIELARRAVDESYVTLNNSIKKDSKQDRLS